MMDIYLKAISRWCDHDPEDCGMKNSRYDNCRCCQQARSVEADFRKQSLWAKIKLLFGSR